MCKGDIELPWSPACRRAAAILAAASAPHGPPSCRVSRCRVTAHDAARAIIGSGHYAIVSTHNDVVGSFATIASPWATRKEKERAQSALRRVAYVASLHGIGSPLCLDGDVVEQAVYESGLHAYLTGSFHGTLGVAQHLHVDVVCDGRPYYLLSGQYDGAALGQDGAVEIGQAFGQDRMAYAGPETDGVPRLLHLYDHPDGRPRLDSWAVGEVLTEVGRDEGCDQVDSRPVEFVRVGDPATALLAGLFPRSNINEVGKQLMERRG